MVFYHIYSVDIDLSISNAHYILSNTSYQIKDIHVIRDRCEVCHKNIAVSTTGHIDRHMARVKGRKRLCPGSGNLSEMIVEINRERKAG